MKPSMIKVVDAIKNKSFTMVNIQEELDQKANELKEKEAMIQ